MRNTLRLTGLGLLLSAFGQFASAQTTAFTYQGRLAEGSSPANGSYDLRVVVLDAASGGNQRGLLTNNAVGVSNGLFTTTLDFGFGVFNGGPRWLELGMRSNGTAASFTTLSPRQAVLPTPYAFWAANASQAVTVSGTVPASGLNGLYSNPVNFSNPANSFAGDGQGLTSVNASQLGGRTAAQFWQMGGNPGTAPGANFLGTTDNQPLEFKVNATRALRLEATAIANTLNVIGGSPNNFAGAGVVGATIGGGGGSGPFLSASTNSVEADFGTVTGGAGNAIQYASAYATIGGGVYNTIQPGANQSTISGGFLNTLQTRAFSATIGGGARNEIQFDSELAVIGGGYQNTIQTNADYATIAGGFLNTILTNATRATIGGGDQNKVGGVYATVPGGVGNQAMGQFSFAAGHDAKALHEGAFVWADSPVGGFSSTANDQFLIKAAGGVGINLNNPNGAALAVNGNVTINGTLGTTGSQPLQFNVNGQRVLYLESNPNGSPNVLSGSPSNRITAGLEGATIAGGGIGLFPNTITASYATIGGGTWNTAAGGWSTIGGGRDNILAGDYSTLSGGRLNLVQTNATYGTISGGHQNTIQTNADYGSIGGGFLNTILINADRATIGGGDQNTAGGTYATVPGGVGNQAMGQFTFAAGHDARALHDGTFVWADAPGGGFSSTGNNQFCIQARGGIQVDPLTSQFFGSQTRQMLNLYGTDYGIGAQFDSLYFRCANSDANSGFIWYKGGVHHDGYAQPGAGGTELMHLVAGGLYVNGAIVLTSDRNAKENFKPVSPREVLDKVAALPLTEWNYKTDASMRHIGPMAQDFYAAFGLGPDDKHIATVDADGVALAAIQGLNQKLEEQRAENAKLKQRLDTLEQIIRNQNSN
ncbi:MAG: tail fiber domain-containing protein [Verrucomicrobiota bacterium]|nr:tail fiber domain-containing protein [Limisphaerales bacterium]